MWKRTYESLSLSVGTHALPPPPFHASSLRHPARHTTVLLHLHLIAIHASSEGPEDDHVSQVGSPTRRHRAAPKETHRHRASCPLARGILWRPPLAVKPSVTSGMPATAARSLPRPLWWRCTLAASRVHDGSRSLSSPSQRPRMLAVCHTRDVRPPPRPVPTAASRSPHHPPRWLHTHIALTVSLPHRLRMLDRSIGRRSTFRALHAANGMKQGEGPGDHGGAGLVFFKLPHRDDNRWSTRS